MRVQIFFVVTFFSLAASAAPTLPETPQESPAKDVPISAFTNKDGKQRSAFDKKKSAFIDKEGNPRSAIDKKRSAFSDKNGKPRSAFTHEDGSSTSAFIHKKRRHERAENNRNEAPVDWESKKFHGEPYVNGQKPSSESKRSAPPPVESSEGHN